MTLEQTHPNFRAKLARLALLAGKPVSDIYAAWVIYSEKCYDQSALLWEFVQWNAEDMGWDVNAAIDAVG